MAYRKGYRNVKRSRAPKTKKGVVRKALRQNARQNVAKVVKQVLARNVETKQAWADTGLFTVNEPINANTDVKYLLPNIAQGTDEGQRIGNSIRAKALYCKGHIMITQPQGASNSVLQYMSSYSRVTARVMVVTFKPKPSQFSNTTSSDMYTNLLQKGATTSAWSGSISDLYSQINSELYTVHYDKRIMLETDTVNTVGTESSGFSVAVSGRGSCRMFRFKIPYNKVLRYADGALQPSNANPFLIIGWVKMNGAAIDTDVQLLSTQVISNFYYTDM